MENKFSNIELICIDLDGTLYYDKFILYDNILETLEKLRKRFKLAFVTNTTSIISDKLSENLINIGILKNKNELFTPIKVAKHFLTKNNISNGLLLADKTNISEFSFFKTKNNGDSVLIATEGYDITFKELSEPLQFLLNGAKLYTLQKNRFYMKNGKPLNDIGAICASLEYSANTKATVFGKPSIEIFRAVSEIHSTDISKMAIIGDDIEFDVNGAMKHGIKGVLVKTGKYSKEFSIKTGIVPDIEINRFSDIISLIGKQYGI